jgi:hypothetical protein
MFPNKEKTERGRGSIHASDNCDKTRQNDFDRHSDYLKRIFFYRHSLIFFKRSINRVYREYVI